MHIIPFYKKLFHHSKSMVAKCFQDRSGCGPASKRVSLAEMLLSWLRKRVTTESHEFQDLQTETSASYLYIHSHLEETPARVDSAG